ncbi:MAG: hypothetical protein FWF59_11055 [Turicibacter sp.]|nr:hypothetical protein [Turicibacter sp.]
MDREDIEELIEEIQLFQSEFDYVEVKTVKGGSPQIKDSLSSSNLSKEKDNQVMAPTVEVTASTVEVVTPDIEIRLNEIAKKALLNPRLDIEELEAIILNLCSIKPLGTLELVKLLNRSKKTVLDRIKVLLERQEIVMLFANFPKHPQQKYYVSSQDGEHQ